MEEKLALFEEKIDYKFKDKTLLENALTHTSYSYEFGTKSNERLEYLGDSILEFIISDILYEKYDNLAEGEMTKVRAATVCEDSLYVVAKKNDFSDFLLLGKSETSNHHEKKALLADSVEAVIAAIYLDGGLESTVKFIVDNFSDILKNATEHVGDKDYKSALQERLQINGDVNIAYSIIKESGPDHNKAFIAKLTCNGKFLSYGKGKSKKLAEMDAARIALKSLNQN